MDQEGEDGIIQTGIDKLVEYLKREGEVGVSEAADSLGVDRDTVITWAQSLQESDVAELQYTARKGRRIRLTGASAEGQEDAGDVPAERLDSIKQLSKEEARLERFADVMSRIKEQLERDETAVESLEDETDNPDDITELESYIQDIEEATEDVEELQAELQELKDDIEGIEEIETFQELAETVEDENGGDDDEELPGVTTLLKRAVSKLSLPSLPGLGRSGSSDGTGTYKCEHCEQIFDTERGLHTHEGMMHPGDVDEEDDG